MQRIEGGLVMLNVGNVDEKRTFFLCAEHEQFLKYIRTKQVFSLRYRGLNDEMQPVHISSVEIEERFFRYPKFQRKTEIQHLTDNGFLELIVEDKRFLYSVLQGGDIDLSLLIIKPLPPETFYKVMAYNLKYVSLKNGAESTDYFNLFLRYKESRPELFFKVDAFAQRVHTPISNFHRHLRPFVLLDGMETTSLDVVTMQPILLSKILTNSISKDRTKNLVNNEYSKWINTGKDIYLMLQEKAGLKTRDEAKKKFFEILFSKPSKALSKMFGASDWINWINNYKTTFEPRNPHGKEKPHSNLAWLLQSTEVAVMSKIWKALIVEKIVFISVHDEIIVKVTDAQKTKEIMTEILGSEFEYFRISSEKKCLFSSTLPTSSTQKENKTVLEQSQTTLPPDLIELQRQYQELEKSGKIEPQHHPQVERYWNNIRDCLRNNNIGLQQGINELNNYKQMITN
ncbi:hypothetical protein ACVWYG_000729 [Pedobacter sp. UYEF25]